MRIAFVTETWLPSADGIITRLLATIDELRERGHEILVVAPHTPAPDRDGITVRTVPTVRFGWVYGGQRWGLPLPRVARYLAEFGPDVVHVLNPVLIGAAGAVGARALGVPLIASHHTDLVRYARDYRLGWIVPALRAHQRRLHGLAQINLATSTTGQAQLHANRIGPVGLWPAGVDQAAYRPAGPARSDDHHRRPTALYVGRIAAEKELHRLAPLAAPDSPYDLTVVGDGPARATLEQRFADRVTFTGSLSGAELARAYQEADVFVFPSTTETLGLVLLEALSSGLPVVAFDSPASRDLLRDCPAARLVRSDRNDQLIPTIGALLDSRPADDLRRVARAHVATRTWDDATQALLDHYQVAIRAAAFKSPRRARTAPALSG
jgi:glycosyltransferase involved in cell wall biosynthesis